MVSAIILAKNEENNIVDCLESIDWCDEIIVIDDFSTDRTLEVIKNFNRRVKIFQHELGGDFSAQRNFGLSKARGEWVLFVDADERLSNGLKGEIMDYVSLKNKNYDGCYMQRKDIIWGKELQHGEVGNIKILRFGKKNAGIWRGKVHEIWEISGSLGNFKMPLLHYPHQSIGSFLREINYYTDLRAKELYDSGIRTDFYQIILYPIAKFILNYFINRGFLDGIEGLVFAIMMSFHSFLVRAKLWTHANKK
ncbi:MAG: glycosyltransferase family 2 protein [Patescibacteria group bacterium]|nr:glycosyltransferase family 2 protein [Patescibacteria group bacterium]